MKLRLIGVLFVVLGVAVLLTARLGATTYYFGISTPTPTPTPSGATLFVATTGNNSNNCTSSSTPCLTIAGAIGKSVAGSIISVASGTYSEIITFTSKSGTSGNPIIVDGSSQGAHALGGRFTNSNFDTIQNFDISNQTGTTPNGYGVYFSGTSHDDQVLTSYIHELCFDGIFMTSSVGNNNLINGDTIYKAGHNAGVDLAGTGTTLTHNDISQTQQRPQLLGGIYAGCPVFNGPGGDDADWIRAFGSNHVISYNNLHDIPHGTVANPIDSFEAHTDCIQTFSSGVEGSGIQNTLIEGNTCIGSNQQEVGSWQSTITGNTMRNNVFAALNGLQLYGSPMSGNDYYNNTFDHLGGEVFVYGNASTGDTIENNMFYDSGNNNDGPISWNGTGVTWTSNDAIMRTGSQGTYCGGSGCPTSFSVVPGFVNYGTSTGVGADYHLLATSNIRDSGTTIGSFSWDKDGTTRPIGPAWSIGAYEK